MKKILVPTDLDGTDEVMEKTSKDLLGSSQVQIDWFVLDRL